MENIDSRFHFSSNKVLTPSSSYQKKFRVTCFLNTPKLKNPYDGPYDMVHILLCFSMSQRQQTDPKRRTSDYLI